MVGIPVSLRRRRVAPPTGIVRAREFDSITNPQPPSPLSLSLFFRKPTEFCFCLSSIDIEGSGVDFCIENQLPRLCLLGRRRRRQPFIPLTFSPVPSVLSPVLYTRFSLLLTLFLVRHFAQTLSTSFYHYPAFDIRTQVPVSCSDQRI